VPRFACYELPPHPASVCRLFQHSPPSNWVELRANTDFFPALYKTISNILDLSVKIYTMITDSYLRRIREEVSYRSFYFGGFFTIWRNRPCNERWEGLRISRVTRASSRRNERTRETAFWWIFPPSNLLSGEYESLETLFWLQVKHKIIFSRKNKWK